MKKILLTLTLALSVGTAFAAGKVIVGTNNQAPQVIGGADSSNNIVPFRLNADGTLSASVQDAFGTIGAYHIVITGNGAAQRTQGSTVTVHSCTFQAIKDDGTANTGNVYAGGSTVTNASGANTGFVLKPGAGIGPVSMSNLNQIYFAADTANDEVAVFCN